MIHMIEVVVWSFSGRSTIILDDLPSSAGLKSRIRRWICCSFFDSSQWIKGCKEDEEAPKNAKETAKTSQPAGRPPNWLRRHPRQTAHSEAARVFYGGDGFYCADNRGAQLPRRHDARPRRVWSEIHTRVGPRPPSGIVLRGSVCCRPPQEWYFICSERSCSI